MTDQANTIYENRYIQVISDTHHIIRVSMNDSYDHDEELKSDDIAYRIDVLREEMQRLSAETRCDVSNYSDWAADEAAALLLMIYADYAAVAYGR